MADTTTAQGQGQTAQASASDGDGKTFTQDEVNRIVAERVSRERTKYEGYVKGDEAEEAKSRADKAEAELAELRAQSERAKTVATVADEALVPIELVQMLNGADAKELAAQVERVKKLFPAYPERIDDGGGRSAAKKTNADRFADAFGGLL